MKHAQIRKSGSAALLLTLTLMSAPAFAEIDLTGNWASREHQDWMERSPGPEVVDYSGIPINDEARTVGLSYMASALSLPERQCLWYSPPYMVLGPFPHRIWAINDPVTGNIVAWQTQATIDRYGLTIWMDGRPHPGKDAPHTFGGFTTGEWDGNVLTTYTTHMKAGYIRRNGLPNSDEATVTMHFIRHGDLLTVSEHVEDPVYLTEPYVVSHTWQLDPAAPIAATPIPCMPSAEVPRLEGEGDVPHYLPGKNPFMNEVTQMYHIPVEAVMGGAETTYPEYRKKMKAGYVPPEKCVRYCCGWENNAAAAALKDCIGRGFASPEEPNGRNGGAADIGPVVQTGAK